MLSGLFFFIKIIFFPSNEEQNKVKADLLNQHSFYYPEASKKGYFIGVRLLKYQITHLLKSKSRTKKINSSDFVFYTLFPSSEDTDLTQVLENRVDLKTKTWYTFNRKNIYQYLSQNEIYVSILFLIFTYPFLTLFALARSNKFNVFLLAESYLISMVFKKVIKNSGCKELFHFYAHEPESNCAYYLNKERCNYVKIPNLNPLFMFNRNIIADEIALTFGYQEDELNSWNSKQKFNNWKTPKLNPFINVNENESNSKSICFYSHASWIRIKEKHGSTWFAEDKMEIKLLEYIKVNQDLFNNGEDITVCLHPKEKQNENQIDESKNYYRNIFGSKVNFFDVEKSSHESFSDFDMGISAFTSIIFERLYCGYKSLIFHDQVSCKFPVRDSEYEKFVFEDFQEISSKLQDYKNKKETDIQYFSNHNRYTHKFIEC
jgi:hypothetical protein